MHKYWPSHTKADNFCTVVQKDLSSQASQADQNVSAHAQCRITSVGCLGTKLLSKLKNLHHRIPRK